MNFYEFFSATRGRKGSLFSTGVAAAAVAFAGLGEVRAEDDITPQDVYLFACATCHQAGLNGAPKYGNSQAWAPRIEQGREKMYENTMNGKGAMPPKGGKPSLTDEQVKMAVDYMVNAAGGWPEGSN